MRDLRNTQGIPALRELLHFQTTSPTPSFFSSSLKAHAPPHALFIQESSIIIIIQASQFNHMAFFLLFLFISSLLLSSSSSHPFPTSPVTEPAADSPQPVIPTLPVPTTPADSPQTIPTQTAQPFLDPVPPTSTEPGLSGSPAGLAPAAAPTAAPVGGANEQPTGDLQQNQQQQLEDSVNGAGQQGQAVQGQGQVQPIGVASEGVQPIGDDDQGQAGQGQQGQALGFGAAQPLVDNTPFDSGSSRVNCISFGYALAFIWFLGRDLGVMIV